MQHDFEILNHMHVDVVFLLIWKADLDLNQLTRPFIQYVDRIRKHKFLQMNAAIPTWTL